jgi:hypothetical protein
MATIVISKEESPNYFVAVESFKTTIDFINRYEIDGCSTGFFSDIPENKRTLKELFTHIMIRYACHKLQSNKMYKWELDIEKRTRDFLHFYFDSDNSNLFVAVW